MLLPRYSLRWFFYIIALVALLGVVIGEGVQGANWALAVAWGVASLAVAWMVMVLFYALVTLYTLVALPAGERKGRAAYYPAPARPRPAATEGASPQHERESESE